MFRLIKIEGGRINVPEPEFYSAGEVLKAGQAVSLSAGKLVKNASAPVYITLAAGVQDQKTPVARINSDQLYETNITASTVGLNVGDKVTLDSGATAVTATTENGIATIVSIDSDDTVTVRF